MSEVAAIPTNLVPVRPNPPPPPSSKPIMEIRLGDSNPKFRRRRRRRRRRTTLCYVQTNRHLLWGDGALPRGLADVEARCGGASPFPVSSDWGGNGGDSGICAGFKYHNMVKIDHMYSLHSWIGLGTFCLYILRWLIGFGVFMGGATEPTRFSMLGWHMAGGRALLFMSTCAALTGLMEKFYFLKLGLHSNEARLINVTGLSILLFGVFVDLSVVLGRYIYIKQGI